MAKACAYLGRQCYFVDGFGEFGESASFAVNLDVKSKAPRNFAEV